MLKSNATQKPIQKVTSETRTGSNLALNIFVYPLPEEMHCGLLKQSPALLLDFWLVEHKVHQLIINSSHNVTRPDEADMFYVPHYAMCEYAVRIYELGVSIAKPGNARWKVEEQVRKTFEKVMEIVQGFGYWTPEFIPRHVFTFGQGRGSNQCGLWEYFPDIRDATFLGVEGRPSLIDCFKPGDDIVIPPYVANVDIIEAVRSEDVEKKYLSHFRGRPWSEVRPAVFENFAHSTDSFLSQDSIYDMGGEGGQLVEEDAKSYYREMASAIFALCPAGYTPWTKRFYEAMLLGCIPVHIPGTFVPPFQNRIEYEQCSINCAYYDLPRLEQRLRIIPPSMIEAMLAYQSTVRNYFVYDDSVKPNASNLILEQLETRMSRLRDSREHHGTGR